LGLIAALGVSSFAPRALAADPAPSLDLRGFYAPTDPNSGMHVESATSPGTGEWSVGLWGNYVYRPITLRDPASGEVGFDVLEHQVTTDVVASIGIRKRLAFGFDLPIALYQGGSSPTASSERVLGEMNLPRQAIGDLGLVAKLTLVQPVGGELGGFALALQERFTVPTGDEASFLGEGNVTSETRLLAEYRLVAIGLHATAGFKYRAEEERFGCEAVRPSPSGADPCLSRFGSELPFGVGLSFKPQVLGLDAKGRLTFFLEASGQLPLFPIAPFESERPARAALGLSARYALGDVSLLAGLETSLTGGIGSAPLRAVLSIGWAPRAHDVDGDGIADEVDLCRELAEDLDGFEDEDGCPEGDNDDDGVPDADDRCPTEKEDEDGYQDEDGCPDPDNDKDGILDAADACPNEAGSASSDPKRRGCPAPAPAGRPGVVPLGPTASPVEPPATPAVPSAPPVESPATPAVPSAPPVESPAP
jgi:hypothetical protein